MPLLVGAGITAADLTEDALGRVLDKLAAAGDRRGREPLGQALNWDPMAAADLARLLRLPDMFGVAATAKAAARAEGAWIPVGRVPAAPHAAWEQRGTIGDRPCRLVVYRSSSLERRKAKTLERELVQARAAGERVADALTPQDFAWAADPEATAATFRATAAVVALHHAGRPRHADGKARPPGLATPG